jgi:hypothetical protein
MLDDFLKANYPHEYQPSHVRQGTKEFKSTIKLQFSHQNRENSYLFLGVPHLYDEGHVVLAWYESAETLPAMLFSAEGDLSCFSH